MTGRLSRRQFVAGAGAAGLGLLAGCGRLPGQAQQPAPVPRVGILVGPVTGASAPGATLRQGLADLGYVEGRDLTIELRVAEVAQLSQVAAELARLPLDVLYAGGPVATQAARDATSTIPIVMLYGADPVADGLVASLARPGGNITGVTTFVSRLTAKRMELLRDTRPGIQRVAVLRDPHRGNPVMEWTDAQTAARALRVQAFSVEVAEPQDLAGSFEAAASEGADAALLLSSVVFFENQPQIVDLAAQYRLPTMYSAKEYVRHGGLMSYGADNVTAGKRTAVYVDKILKGANPADLPVEQPMTFDFVVNMKTARELGITFPNEIMLQVTDIVQ